MPECNQDAEDAGDHAAGERRQQESQRRIHLHNGGIYLSLLVSPRNVRNDTYGVIHRLATNGKQKGVSEACLDWCFQRWPNVRVDTHRDNKVMQHILTKYGFQRCGIIYVNNGTERIAYQMERLHGGVEESDRTEV